MLFIKISREEFIEKGGRLGITVTVGSGIEPGPTEQLYDQPTHHPNTLNIFEQIIFFIKRWTVCISKVGYVIIWTVREGDNLQGLDL